MPRPPRIDYPGAWHHVYNRGVARRTILESDVDARMFLALLARQVRGGLVEVHAFALMQTHYHLLLRSPLGRLPRAMARLQDGYSHWFNRTRGRDGPLFRGRYGSRVVESDAHWFAVVPYIHDNPVAAGMVPRAEDHPYSSAGAYLRGAGPPWLRRDVVEAEFGTRRRQGPTAPPAPSLRWLVGRWLHGPRAAGIRDPLDEVAGLNSDGVRLWMERNARLADGTLPGWTMASPETVRVAVKERWEGLREPGSGPGAVPWPGPEAVEAGVLRAFCGLSVREVAARLELPAWKTKDLVLEYGLRFRESPAFREAMSTLLQECLGRDHPVGGDRWGERWVMGWATAGPRSRADRHGERLKGASKAG